MDSSATEKNTAPTTLFSQERNTAPPMEMKIPAAMARLKERFSIAPRSLPR